MNNQTGQNPEGRIGVLKYSCRYPNCKSKYYSPVYQKEFYNKTYFRFPKNGDVARQWKEICNIDHSVMAENFFLCEDHFAPKDFTNHIKNRLNSGVVPVRPYIRLTAKDHDYIKNTVDTIPADNLTELTTLIQKTTANPLEKYSFLFDSIEEILTDSSGSQSKKLRMLNIHQAVMSNLLRLKNLLYKEKSTLQKLYRLYKDGKFDYLIMQLRHVPNEFIETQLVTSFTKSDWTEEDNYLAMSFYNKTEKLYKYLYIVFHLPSVKTLQQLSSRIPLKTGISKTIMGQVKLDVQKMNSGNRNCTLMISEMLLTSGLYYEDDNQQFCGYEDMSNLGRSSKKADRVIVLMARGVRKNWTQVISYYFSSGPFNPIHLQNIIVTNIKVLQATGLYVVALVCKQSKTNLEALHLLCARIERHIHASYFIVNGKRVCIIYDASHLLIETWSALTRCDILYDKQTGKTAKMEHIESAYNLDKSKRVYKQLYKLQDQYFDENDSTNKTCVAAAAKTLSHTMAASIETFVILGDLPQEAMNTAEFVEIMDMLYDSLNSSEGRPQDYKKYKCALSVNSPHCKFWSPLAAHINNWTLIDRESRGNVTNNYHFVGGWQGTLDSLFYIWSHLKHEGYFGYLFLTRFNLQPLENLLEKITQYGTSNKNPTCRQFMAAIKSEMVARVQEPWSTDDCHPLTSLRVFTKDVFTEDPSSWPSTSVVYFDSIDFDAINMLQFHEMIAYLSGYLLQKIDIPDCDTCKFHLLADWVLKNNESVSVKDCGADSTFSLYASDAVIRIVDKILYLLFCFLKAQSYERNLEDDFKALHRHEFEAFKFCENHNCNEELINMCIKLGIYRFIYNPKA